METSKILSADILDILFEGRNKSYGAYELRRSYDRRIIKALGATLVVCLLFAAGSILANGKARKLNDEISIPVSLEDFKEQPKQELPQAGCTATAKSGNGKSDQTADRARR